MQCLNKSLNDDGSSGGTVRGALRKLPRPYISQDLVRQLDGRGILYRKEGRTTARLLLRTDLDAPAPYHDASVPPADPTTPEVVQNPPLYASSADSDPDLQASYVFYRVITALLAARIDGVPSPNFTSGIKEHYYHLSFGYGPDEEEQDEAVAILHLLAQTHASICIISISRKANRRGCSILRRQYEQRGEVGRSCSLCVMPSCKAESYQRREIGEEI